MVPNTTSGGAGCDLVLDRVTARYPGAHRPALEEVSFKLHPGVTLLLGENGAGKTTLFRLALGALQPSGGSVTRPDPGRFGYCPQSFALPPTATLIEYLKYVAWLKGLPNSQIESESSRAAEVVDLAGQLNDKLRTLSGGQARRVGLAVATLGTPEVLLLDEPTAGLDPAARVAVREALGRLAIHSKVLLSTHIPDDVATIGSGARVAVLSAGRMVFDGDAKEIGITESSQGSMSQAEAAIVRAMRGIE